MPKISEKDVSVYHKDIKKDYKVIVMYNQESLFYAKIHSEFSEEVKHLSKEELSKFGMERMYKKSSDRFNNSPAEYIISCGTESKLIEKVKEAYAALLDKSIIQRKVIVVFYNGDNTTSYGGHRHNRDHPLLGMQFSLTYAVETSAGDKKIYSTYREYEAFGDKRTERDELSLWNRSCTIIPDTSENRKTLESLYDAFAKLNEKLKEFTSSDTKLLEFISSKVKLLS